MTFMKHSASRLQMFSKCKTSFLLKKKKMLLEKQGYENRLRKVEVQDSLTLFKDTPLVDLSSLPAVGFTLEVGKIGKGQIMQAMVWNQEWPDLKGFEVLIFVLQLTKLVPTQEPLNFLFPHLEPQMATRLTPLEHSVSLLHEGDLYLT